MRIISGTARGTKLYTLENLATRPTLDRVKESIFNIIQNDIRDSVVLDLFAGSGAFGLEAVSRGAQKAILCDKSKDAMNIINKNIEKTHFENLIKTYNMDFEDCLRKINGTKLDIVFLDPPYKTNYVIKALTLMLELNLINENTKLIVETDIEEEVLKEIQKIPIEVTDRRKYGRANIIFAKKRGLEKGKE